MGRRGRDQEKEKQQQYKNKVMTDEQKHGKGKYRQKGIKT
jgi:hypothetical protein